MSCDATSRPTVDSAAWRGDASYGILQIKNRGIRPVQQSPAVTGRDEEHVAEQLRAFGLGEEDLTAWRRSGLDGPAFLDWLTDRVARRPAGSRARRVYGAEDVHDFARRAILDALALANSDHLLELGCGGGLLLRDALTAGARTTGLDHSGEMVALARERAPEAHVVLGEADSLPFPDDTFTAVAMSIVFLFLEAPNRVLGECSRVMSPGGRLAIYTTGPELRGTPAAPEPIASRSHYYTDQQLGALAKTAGFIGVRVRSEGGGQLLTARIGRPPDTRISRRQSETRSERGNR